VIPFEIFSESHGMLILMPSIAFSQIYEAFVLANLLRTSSGIPRKTGLEIIFGIHVLVRHENSPAFQRWVNDYDTDRKVPLGTAERFFRPAGLTQFIDLNPALKRWAIIISGTRPETRVRSRIRSLASASGEQNRARKISCLQSRERVVNEPRAARQRLTM
jgi:hypothetical protein